MRTLRLALLGLIALGATAAHAEPGRWVQSWGASPAPPSNVPAAPPPLGTPVFEEQTIVQVVRISAGGQRLRVRFTNEYGRTPLNIGAARVALLGADGKPLAGSEKALSFGGLAAIAVPPGAPMLSDPVDLPASALGSVQVALYLPGKTPDCTCHAAGGPTALVSPPGDYTQRPFTPVAKPSGPFRAYLSGVEVESAQRGPVIVAFGDSITDGYLTTGANGRWPDRLAERLHEKNPRRPAAVVNAGLSGNQLLADGRMAIFGQSALTRFDRDVLSVPGATHLIVLEGVNDLGGGLTNPPSAATLIAAYRQLIDRAHAHGLKAIGGTILPYEGAAYHRPEGEAVRQEVNAWIRSGKGFDGVIDFDAAMRDPAQPNRLRKELQSGDWLHPNAAGYRAMGEAIDLKLFEGR